MNALELLTEDHEKVAELFSQLEDSESESARLNLFGKIKTELETHTHIEETLFYPMLEDYEELQDLITQAYEEHKQVKTLLREIEQLARGSVLLDAKLNVLQENVEHHVEEEEGELFPQVEDIIEEEELENLGNEMMTAKQEFQKAYKATSGRK
ncbi:MAG: hemerythrin domain-containing protein [Acidobacteriota bacterium]